MIPIMKILLTAYAIYGIYYSIQRVFLIGKYSVKNSTNFNNQKDYNLSTTEMDTKEIYSVNPESFQLHYFWFQGSTNV